MLHLAFYKQRSRAREDRLLPSLPEEQRLVLLSELGFPGDPGNELLHIPLTEGKPVGEEGLYLLISPPVHV